MANEIDTMIVHNVMSLMNSNEASVVYFASMNWTVFVLCSIANKDENKQEPTPQSSNGEKEESSTHFRCSIGK